MRSKILFVKYSNKVFDLSFIPDAHESFSVLYAGDDHRKNKCDW